LALALAANLVGSHVRRDRVLHVNRSTLIDESRDIGESEAAGDIGRDNGSGTDRLAHLVAERRSTALLVRSKLEIVAGNLGGDRLAERLLPELLELGN
jgi:hypothetical protein